MQSTLVMQRKPVLSDAYVIVESGVSQGERIPLPIPGRLMLGRAPECHIRFDPDREAMVSRQHATLDVRRDGVVLTDLKSANGTLVRGQTISGSVMLEDGERFQLGTKGPVLVVHFAWRELPPPPQKPDASRNKSPSTLIMTVPPRPGETDSARSGLNGSRGPGRVSPTPAPSHAPGHASPSRTAVPQAAAYPSAPTPAAPQVRSAATRRPGPPTQESVPAAPRDERDLLPGEIHSLFDAPSPDPFSTAWPEPPRPGSSQTVQLAQERGMLDGYDEIQRQRAGQVHPDQGLGMAGAAHGFAIPETGGASSSSSWGHPAPWPAEDTEQALPPHSAAQTEPGPAQGTARAVLPNKGLPVPVEATPLSWVLSVNRGFVAQLLVILCILGISSALGVAYGLSSRPQPSPATHSIDPG